MRSVARTLPTLKHRGFEGEAESRIVCAAGMHIDLMYLKHRPGRLGLIPYVELGVPVNPLGDFGKGPEPMEKLPILGVVVGPARYKEEAKVGAQELLRSHGREVFGVTESKIPFRS